MSFMAFMLKDFVVKGFFMYNLRFTMYNLHRDAKQIFLFLCVFASSRSLLYKVPSLGEG